MAGGKFAAYQRLRPLQGDITTDLLNAENQEFKHRAEDRINEDRKLKAQALKEKKAKEGIARAKGLKLYDTGSDSLNESLAEAITIATNEYPKIFEVLDDQNGKYTQAEKIKAKLKYDNILNLPENLKTMTNAVMGEYQDYQKGVAAGTLFRDEAYEKKFENGFKGVSLTFDDDGLPVAVFRKGQKDINGDGVINDLDIETMSSLNDVYSRPQFQRNFNYDSLIKQHAEKLESAENAKVSGFKTTTTTGVEPDLLIDSVQRVLYNKDGSISDVMSALIRQKGLDPNSKIDQKTIEDDYKNDVYIRTKRGKVEKLDAGAIVANKKENRLAKDSKATLGEVVTPTKATWGKQFKNIDTNKVNSVPVKGVNISAIPLDDGRTITNAKVVNYTYDKDDNMIVDVVYQDTKSETMSEEKYTKELEEATKNKDFSKIAILQAASDVDGGKKITKPGQNKKEQISISNENESKIANELGLSIEEMKARAQKNLGEVDEFGVPIKK